MLKLFDRQLIKSYLKSYAICFVSLLSLYIVVDMFTNIDDLPTQSGLVKVLGHIGMYYGYKAFQIFDRLSEAIVLLAAMFTVAWLQRNNELLPLLSAGVSTRRVVRPVVLSACLMLSLTVLNQELVIPRIGQMLFNQRSDPEGKEDVFLPWAYDTNGILLDGQSASKTRQSIRPLDVTIPEHMANGLVYLIAQEGHYVPPGPGRTSGGWLLLDTQPRELPEWNNPDVLVMIDPGKYFLKTQDVDFNAMIRGRKWFIFSSTAELYRDMARPDSPRLSSMAVLFHMRLTRPLLGVLLVWLGLAVILRDQNRNVFLSAGLCLGWGALQFAVTLCCKFLGEHDYLAPALAAWLPVLIFAPIAFVLFDAVHT